MADDSGLFRCSLGKQGADVINLLSAEPQQLGRHPLPLTRVESQATTFTVIDPMELAGHAPLGATSQAEGTPLVEAGRCGMGFEIGGVKHQDLWLRGIGWLCGVGC